MFDKIKAHISEHKVAYTFGATVIIAGITYAILKKSCIEALANGGAYGPETADTLVTNQPFFSIFSGQKSIVIRQEIGRPPYLVHDLTTDLYYKSQNAVAKALGATDAMVSNHINGKLPHVQGHILERVYSE